MDILDIRYFTNLTTSVVLSIIHTHATIHYVLMNVVLKYCIHGFSTCTCYMYIKNPCCIYIKGLHVFHTMSCIYDTSVRNSHCKTSDMLKRACSVCQFLCAK